MRKQSYNTIDLTGKRFGRLTVVSFSGSNSTGKRTWICMCDCGVKTIVATGDLRSGNTESCSCLKREKTGNRSYKHGLVKTSEYHTWSGLIQRCTNKKSDSYEYYGGDGVSVCKRWRDSFENFYADMGPKPTPKHTIDRYPNQKGNYEPGNCRWATKEQQSSNMSSNVLITHEGKTLTISNWARLLLLNRNTISKRLKMGLESKDILGSADRKRMITWNGETMNVRKWSRKTGINYQTLMYRIHKCGMNPPELFHRERKNRKRGLVESEIV